MTDTTASTIEGGQGAAPAAAPAAPAATSTQVATPPAQPTAAAVPWLDGADEIKVGYVQNKAWKSPVEMLDSYQNLEKLLGADRAGNTVILPKADAAPEEWAKFHERLGRPADASGYKIEVPEVIGDPEFAKTAAGKFHELGLTQKQGESLAKWWNETITGQVAQQQASQATSFQAQDAELKTEWGAAFTQNLAQAQAGVREMGVSKEQIDALSNVWGHKATMQFFQKLGAKAAEPGFVSGDKTQGFSDVMTPGQAKAQIKANMADKEFMKQYLSKNAERVAEMERLHKWAYPE